MLRKRRFDLHLHSDRSDGILSPEALIERCVAGKLEVISITDHDLAVDMPYGVQKVGSSEIHLIPGAEVSGVHEGHEFHLLVYFPRTVPTRFHDFCRERCQERANRYDESVQNIGFSDVPPASSAAHRGERALTRRHLADALVDRGHAADLRDAFRRFADTSHGHVPKISLPFVDAIRIAREAGGVTSWAHPALASLVAYLPTFAEAGLHGVEAHRPTVSGSAKKKTRALAKRHGLFLTGGSDWHGWRGDQPGLFFVERTDLGGFLAALEAAA